MGSKAQNAKNDSARLRALRSAENLQMFEEGQQLNSDKVTQFLDGLYCKGLAHKDDGTLRGEEVDQYQLLVAMEAGDQDALNQITLGGARLLVNTQAAFATEIEGGIPYGMTMPAPPNVSDRWAAAELTETYEMCMAADISFSDLNSNNANTLADRAVANLNSYGDDYMGPGMGGTLDRKNLFRGTAYGNQFGPYVSQFLMHDFNLGVNPITQKYLPETGLYGVSEANFLEIQKGNVPVPQTMGGTPLRPYSPRSLSSMVHVDFVYQFFYYAAQMIVDAGIPRQGAYTDIYPDAAFVTNGGVVHIATAMADVCKNAMTAAWLQKWRNHLRLRPEEMAGKVVKQEEGTLTGVIHPDLFTNSASTLAAVKSFNAPTSGEAKSFMPLNYAEGSPTHPAYPSGHAAVAGAATTVLKMIFANENWTQMGSFAPIYESPDGNALSAYGGGDTAAMTVHTELNKLASNCSHGRAMAGVHYRSDGDLGMELGEKVAIAYYKDYLSRQIEPYGAISFTKFDGTTFTLEAGGGQTRALGEAVKRQRDI